MDEITEDKFLELGEAAEGAGRECIAIFKDEDGNWRGGIKKGTRMAFVRDIGPETVLQLLLTHDGK